MKKTRIAADGRTTVCNCCHKIRKFCGCALDAKPTCPICPKVDGRFVEHDVDDCPRVKDLPDP